MLASYRASLEHIKAPRRPSVARLRQFRARRLNGPDGPIWAARWLYSQAMSEHIEAFKEWVSTIREDIDTIEAIVGAESVDREARRYAAAALNYLVTRMDLVPDWEESVGVIDDVMVIRICLELASQHDLDEGLEDAKHVVAVGRLLNEHGRIEEFLGAELYADLRKHCVHLADSVVRGRSTETILDDKGVREALIAEVAEDIKRMPAAAFADPESVALKFKSYLSHKLKS